MPFWRPSETRTPPSSGCAAGASNASDMPGGVLQRNNIHLAVCAPGEVTTTLDALRGKPERRPRPRRSSSWRPTARLSRPRTSSSGETVACAYDDFPDHFGFFLPLAGITTVKQIRENSFDIRATSRLNRLYVELLQGQSRLGHGRAPPRHEPLHGAADLLLLRRGHRHLQRRPACSPPRSSR